MDVRFVSAGSGDVVAIMAGEGGHLAAAAQALDSASGGRITKALKAAQFKGAPGQVAEVLAPEGVDYGR